VNSIVVTPDGRLFISVSSEGTLKIWNLASWKELYKRPGNKSSFLSEYSARSTGPGGTLWVRSALALTPDGKVLILAASEETSQFWEIGVSFDVRVLEPTIVGFKPVVVMPDGKRAVFGLGHQMKMFDLHDGKEIVTFAGYTSPFAAMAMAVTPGGELLISGSDNGTLTTWESSSGKEVWSIKAHAGWIRAVAVTPDGKKVISGGDDKAVKVWNLGTGREDFILEGHASEVNAVAVSPDGELVFSASSDRTIKMWSLKDGRQSRSAPPHSDEVSAVVLTSDGKFAISASFDGTLKLWEVDTASELGVLGGHTHGPKRVRAVTVSSDGKLAFSGSDDRTLKVWNIASRREIQSLEGHSGWVTAVAAAPDGDLVISAHDDFPQRMILRLWSLARGSEVWSLEEEGVRWTRQLAISPDGQLLISPSKDGALKVRDLASGQELRSMRGHSGEIHAVAVIPDGRLAISASHDKTLRIWELESGREVRTLTGHTSCVQAVAVTRDGKRAVSVSRDCTLRVWDLSRGVVIATFTADAAMDACAVAPDGRTIVAGDELGRVHFLRLEGG
jgi:WD40 repeat protein